MGWVPEVFLQGFYPFSLLGCVEDNGFLDAFPNLGFDLPFPMVVLAPFEYRKLLEVLHLHSDDVGDSIHLLIAILGHLPHCAFDLLILKDGVDAERNIPVLSLRPQEDPFLDLLEVAVSGVLKDIEDDIGVVEDGNI